MLQLIKRALASRGYELTSPAERESVAIGDLSQADRAIVARVAPYTMTGLERRASLLGAVDHLVRQRVEGDIVECGVWRGGSVMAIALALLDRGDATRHLYLYDTYDGMTAPTEVDRSLGGAAAADRLAASDRSAPIWARATLDDVQANLASTQYPPELLHFVAGPVETTIPATLPERIALLRLDTDWYASTRHELQHLYPLLAPGGVMIIDDYGHWQGARRAVDEYFGDRAEAPYLHRVDYTARLVVKPAR